MADRNVAASNTFEQFRVEFNELATDVGDIASITGATGIIASATDVVEAVTLLNTAVNNIDVDITGDTGNSTIDNEIDSLSKLTVTIDVRPSSIPTWFVSAFIITIIVNGAILIALLVRRNYDIL